MAAWTGIITKEEERRYASAGFGGEGGFGIRPALLIIDVQYRTVGTKRVPYWEAIKEYPTSCGAAGWDAVEKIAPLLAVFRAKGFPVLYPHVALKNAATDGGRLAQKIPSIMSIDAKGYEFVEDIAPAAGDIILPKKHPSVITGCTTSGCVRSSVTDAFALNFKVIVPDDCVYDRAATSHAVNLWDMNSKYADVMSSADVTEKLIGLECAP